MSTATPPQDQLRADWDRLASGFDTFMTPKNIAVAGDALQRVELRPSTRVLDVGAGSGALTIAAARAGAPVIAIDVAPAMIERLAARAAAEELTSVSAMVMDCRALSFDENTFDLVASQHGVTMLPQASAGLSEMARVTRPGGTVLVVAFGRPAEFEPLRFLIGAITAAVPDFSGSPTEPPPPFQLADPDVFHRSMADVGLTSVSVETIHWRLPIGSGAELWDAVTTSHPVAAGMVAELTAAQRSDVRRVLDGMICERADGQQRAVLRAEINLGIGVKPTG